MVREPGPNEVHPTVTVVVPTLAADETLTACLDSFDHQTFTDFEIVVVDNSLPLIECAISRGFE